MEDNTYGIDNNQNDPNSFVDSLVYGDWDRPMDTQSFGLHIPQAEVGPSVIAPLTPNQLNSSNCHHDFSDVGAAVLGQRFIHGSDTIALDGRPRRTRRPKSKAPPNSDWLKHKPIIRDLYLEKDNTLESTRQIMKDDYDFDVTPNLYKQKFQEWGWIKNIPQCWTPKLTQLAEERQPKETVFQLGPRKWTADEIRKKRGRANLNDQEDSPVLPAELIIRTPSHASLSLSPDSPISASPRPSQGSPVNLVNRSSATRASTPGPLSPAWVPHHPPSLGPSMGPGTPSNLPSADFMNYPWSRSDFTGSWQGGSHPLYSFRVDGKSFADLQQKRSYAKDLASQGQLKKAADDLKEVLLGFRHLFTPTHKHTTETAYELADILRQDDRMAEADSILNWIGENCIRKFGLCHKNTLKHFMRAIILLKSWSRHQDANLLIHKIIDLIEVGGAKSAPLLPDADSGIDSMKNIEDIEIDTIFGDLQNNEQVDAQLRLVELLLESCPETTKKLEETLQNIISFCNEKPIEDAIRLTRARYWLTKLYLGTNQKHEADLTFDSAVELLKKHIYNAKESMMPITLVGEARKLAFLHPNPRVCDEVLEMLADHLEDRIRSRDQSGVCVVDFLTQVGITWQKKSWNLAAPWFQRALGLSLTTFGKKNPQTVELEEALEEQRYHVGGRSEFDVYCSSIGEI
ncbi:hypothetical protein M434DRAFT_12348 [Hypoxylon sp. CO27-5]|nr:hypothetical protein M434DRAFT_12348 [Hypoxylon sp. CO27-5]